MSFDLETLQAEIARHGAVVRVVVACVKGSSPREAGAAMLVWAGGQSGTIGGGTLELEATHKARQMLRAEQQGAAVTRMPLGPALGQCCGGVVTLVSEYLDDARLPSGHEPCYVRRVAGEADMPQALVQALAAPLCDWRADVMFEEGWLAERFVPQQAPLWIWGAGHVGRSIVEVMAPLPEIGITWVDTGVERFPDQPKAKVIPAPDPGAAVTLAPTGAHHLVLTYSHQLDLELCHRLLSHGFQSAGLIGSKTKWSRFQKRLVDLGHSPEAIGRITCPIGQPEFGKHPHAIAVGVAGQLLHLLHGYGGLQGSAHGRAHTQEGACVL